MTHPCNAAALYRVITSNSKATPEQRLSCVVFLLGEKVDVNWQDPETGDTVLIAAAKKGFEDIFKYLLATGADATPVNREGVSVVGLLSAASSRNAAAARMHRCFSATTVLEAKQDSNQRTTMTGFVPKGAQPQNFPQPAASAAFNAVPVSRPAFQVPRVIRMPFLQ